MKTNHRLAAEIILVALLGFLTGCGRNVGETPRLHWYVFDEPSGAFEQAARFCTRASQGRYLIKLASLPTNADLQREQLVRRLAAGDADVDIIGMDVIWTAEFAQAGWILPWNQAAARRIRAVRLRSAIDSATWEHRLWAAPFTTNAQLLWYRTDRVATPPANWNDLISAAERLGENGLIEAQGARFEGLTVFFVSLLASAGGSVLMPDNADRVALAEEPTRRALAIMRRLARSNAADPGARHRAGGSGAARVRIRESQLHGQLHLRVAQCPANAPGVAEHMGWARWPAVIESQDSHVTVGGINLGVGAHSPHPDLAFDAAACLAAEPNQRLAATRGGLPPTIAALYDDHDVRAMLPFADLLRETLNDCRAAPADTPLRRCVARHQPHPAPDAGYRSRSRDVKRLREAVNRAAARGRSGVKRPANAEHRLAWLLCAPAVIAMLLVTA